MRPSLPYTLAATIGFSAGLRSLTPAATVAQAARRNTLALDADRWKWLRHDAVAHGLTALAVAELIGDKLPNTPARTMPVPLIARALSGGLCGAVVTSAAKASPIRGALLGSLAAVAGTFLGYHARLAAHTQLKSPDMLTAVLEDALTVAISTKVVSALREALPNASVTPATRSAAPPVRCPDPPVLVSSIHPAPSALPQSHPA